jgi:hypothetical protein
MQALVDSALDADGCTRVMDTLRTAGLVEVGQSRARKHNGELVGVTFEGRRPVGAA